MSLTQLRREPLMSCQPSLSYSAWNFRGNIEGQSLLDESRAEDVLAVRKQTSDPIVLDDVERGVDAARDYVGSLFGDKDGRIPQSLFIWRF